MKTRAFLFAGLTLLGWLTGCASSPVAQPAPTVASSPSKPAPDPDPGSLWSEDSQWNRIFALASSRVVGESITLRVQKGLIDKVKASRDHDTPPPKSQGAAQGSQPKEAPAAQDAKSSGATEAQSVEGTITEVLPRDMFKVSINQPLKLGTDETKVDIVGIVRERDIAEDNSVSSDALINPMVQVDKDEKPGDKGRAPAGTTDNGKEAAK